MKKQGLGSSLGNVPLPKNCKNKFNDAFLVHYVTEHAVEPVKSASHVG